MASLGVDGYSWQGVLDELLDLQARGMLGPQDLPLIDKARKLVAKETAARANQMTFLSVAFALRFQAEIQDEIARSRELDGLPSVDRKRPVTELVFALF